ncbi:DcaP family trimeric outer membrane transporter [Carboxylicivirga marina]|uniref:Porin n=1 Tax=Carboxylicivirga marina TaxID=2800988 RepID=A0ABS1HJC8_9BACT|nr:DcaP family trimeric outer membrane transporter [Carboxylicivirga marina]MBK3517788.1 hypothetical protein [Carboxylicivirga marina]
MKKLFYPLLLFMTIGVCAQENESQTTFKFGGYIKADFINTWYENGDVGESSPLRDFHLPSQIPVGAKDEHIDLDYHVKESRFNFDVKTNLLGKEIHGFIELDFMMSKAGDEKVTNSYNPRIRHAYFEWDKLLIGQTWSTFMVVVVPDEIDFAGAMDGLVFVRQPQIRFKLGNWWLALENPETTITPYQESHTEVTESEVSPDIIFRNNFSGDWGNWAVAIMGRTLHKKDSIKHYAMGVGITTGGKIKVGRRGDDIRMMATYGTGLGRYLSAGFSAGAVVDNEGALNTIDVVNAYIAYNHFWKPKVWSSSFSVAVYNAMHDDNLVVPEINKSSYSISGNIKWDIAPQLRFGAEYMYGYRELQGGVNGAFHRLQLAAKYTFGYNNTVADEKR